MIVHFAYSVVLTVVGVAKLNELARPLSEYQPTKVLPVLVGAVGAVAVVLYGTLWLVTALPPLLLNVTV